MIVQLSRRLPELLLSSFAGALGGFVAAVIVYQSRFLHGLRSIDAGDWLQAVATAAGIIATIIATRWLEDRKRRQDFSATYRLLRSAMGYVNTAAQLGQSPLPADVELPEKFNIQAKKYEMMRNAMASLKEARRGLAIRSLELLESLRVIDADFAMNEAMLAREEGLVREFGTSERVLAIAGDRLGEFSARIAPAVQTAVESLNEQWRCEGHGD